MSSATCIKSARGDIPLFINIPTSPQGSKKNATSFNRSRSMYGSSSQRGGDSPSGKMLDCPIYPLDLSPALPERHPNQRSSWCCEPNSRTPASMSRSQSMDFQPQAQLDSSPRIPRRSHDGEACGDPPRRPRRKESRGLVDFDQEEDDRSGPASVPDL